MRALALRFPDCGHAPSPYPACAPDAFPVRPHPGVKADGRAALGVPPPSITAPAATRDLRPRGPGRPPAMRPRLGFFPGSPEPGVRGAGSVVAFGPVRARIRASTNREGGR